MLGDNLTEFKAFVKSVTTLTAWPWRATRPLYLIEVQLDAARLFASGREARSDVVLALSPSMPLDAAKAMVLARLARGSDPDA